jgi:hypothetical protein
VAHTRPDLILQPDQPVRSGLVGVPESGIADISTLQTG